MSFPEQPFGFVAGRWVRSIGDTPDDADRAPDYVPVETGTVVFTPQVTHRVAADGTGWAGIIKDRIPARLGERGQLIDAEGHDHLALAVGVYSVSYDFGLGRSWPSHYIEVKTEHTATAPLWLPPIAPPPEGPMIENRVVTIPADGADGQVLVWDGAGFTWMDAPAGPQGPPGEVTTAALTSALAGKVTGTGMSVRVDKSVGTRVLLDHPGGTTMLMGDTGWRDITSLLEPGWALANPFGMFKLRLTTHTLDLSARIQVAPDAAFIDITRIASQRLITLPAGFRIAMNYVAAGPAPIASVLAGYVEVDSPTRLVFRGMSGTWAAGDLLNFTVSVPRENTWPTTLPGTPL